MRSARSFGFSCLSTDSPAASPCWPLDERQLFTYSVDGSRGKGANTCAASSVLIFHGWRLVGRTPSFCRLMPLEDTFSAVITFSQIVPLPSPPLRSVAAALGGRPRNGRHARAVFCGPDAVSRLCAQRRVDWKSLQSGVSQGRCVSAFLPQSVDAERRGSRGDGTSRLRGQPADILLRECGASPAHSGFTLTQAHFFFFFIISFQQ